jgi:all-trans-nonaprenyl-diphosphate synthase
VKQFDSYEQLVEIYVNKTYYKTAALISHGCKGVGLLHPNEDLSGACFEFGKHIGLAFQYIDDVLDFTSTSEVLGKPAHNDMR